MKVVAAYLLAVLGSKTNPSAADIKKILASAAAEAKKEEKVEEKAESSDDV
ncbi:hypothetical protein Golob_011948, partial [Gossypium lobatum]|nr:hypothetical protein [Gossypium lobatum]